MKKIIFSLLTIGMIVGLSNNLVAQETATGTATATATIVAPITITAETNLMFGKIIAGAGTVAISTGDVRTITPALDPGNQDGTVAAATFTVTGESGLIYSIELPGNDTVTLTGPQDATAMTVTSFTALSVGGDGSTTGTLTGGNDLLKVGATLTVNAAQAVGEYSGDFNVTVAYN